MGFYADSSEAIQDEIESLGKQWRATEDQVLGIMELIRDREKMKNERIQK